MDSRRSLSALYSEVKRSLRIALPLMASEMIYASNAFAATLMVARLGKYPLAANALVWGVYITVTVFFIGIYSAVSILIAQSHGACDPRGISLSFKQGLILAIVLSWPMALIMGVAPVVLQWTGQNPEVIGYATPFFHSLIWTMLPFSLLIVLEQFLVGIAKPGFVLWTSIIQVPVQIFFYYALLFGKFGFPALGIAGIGYGMTIAFYVAAIVTGCYLYFTKRFSEYRLFEKWWHVNKKFLSEIIRVGLPLGFIYTVEVALFGTVAFMMGALGAAVLAAYQIAYQYLIVALTLIFVFTQTATVRVGNEVGRDNRDAIRLVHLANIGLSLAFVLPICAGFLGFPSFLIGLDLDIHAAHNQAIVHQATLFLAIMCALLISDCVRIVSFGALRGLKDTRFPMIASIIGFWCIAFPAAYLFAFKFHFGGAGIWWGMVLGLFTAGIILFARFTRLIRRINLEKLITR